jgi:hypothetical protein
VTSQHFGADATDSRDAGNVCSVYDFASAAAVLEALARVILTMSSNTECQVDLLLLVQCRLAL